MSIPVDVEQLAEAMVDFGSAYLLSTSEGRIKAVTVDPIVRDGRLVVTPSAGTARNLAANPLVTVVFPPREAKGYSLIVDGHGEDLGDAIAVTPAAAVLHRPASHGDGATTDGCGNDCQPLDGRH